MEMTYRNFKMTLYSVEYKLQNYNRSNQDTSLVQRPAVKEGDWVCTGDLLADASASAGGELALGQNIFIAYMPWEGYNYEDAILISQRLVFDDVYTSIHIESYELQTRMTKYGVEEMTKNIPDIAKTQVCHLKEDGTPKNGSWVQEGDILVGKITPIQQKFQSAYQKLLFTVLEKQLQPARDSSLRTPRGYKGKVVHVQILKRSKQKKIEKVQVYLAERRKVQVGDKMAGRHGNKGIISKILPREDMPYLPDGTPIDMVLNPLGVPSRMNVGQIYESLLGLAAKYLGTSFRIPAFDELYGPQASRTLTYYSLYKARQKTGKSWLFRPNHPGKIKIFDGRTGNFFDQAVTVGIAYMLKLVHQVDDKIHMRSTGPYSLVTQQPLRGRSKAGGQRVGEMEVWALQGYGAAFTLLELLTIKSDDMTGRMTLWSNIIQHREIYIGTPESFKVLICELQALCLDIGLYKLDQKQFLNKIEHLIQLP
nr:RNA polymerase beta subunit protein b [Follicularia botryoides]